MTSSPPPWAWGGLVGLAMLTGVARADVLVPPWAEDDVPLPSWARSVVPRPGDDGRSGDLVLFSGPTRNSARRGVTAKGSALPFFAAHAGGGCAGPWWLVGPLAWVCADDASLSPADPSSPPKPSSAPGEYFFVNHEGASAYVDLDAAAEGTADRELEGGWGVSIVEQRTASGQKWSRTSKGLWIAAKDLVPARVSAFEGQPVTAEPLDLAWVIVDAAAEYAQPNAKAKTKKTRSRLDLVHVLQDSAGYLRIGDAAWLSSRDVARPHVEAPPPEVSGSLERWIDVELATQTLVAYEGARPVYTTLVSTGRGPTGSDSATPLGAHRVWVKLRSSDMDNVERGDLDAHYSLEAVPYVQFFDQAVGLHGTYWHRDFGRVKSHGCVNLSLADARWLFDFTAPRLPASWVAAYPTAGETGTIVRVR